MILRGSGQEKAVRTLVRPVGNLKRAAGPSLAAKTRLDLASDSGTNSEFDTPCSVSGI